jgi:oligopeptide/dipeptide ABC transporter ATP-binding protein
MSKRILEVKNLKTYIHDNRHKKLLRIVDGVSFEVNDSEALGIFGESGSGKTSVAHSIMGLMPENPGIVDGEIWLYDGLQKQNLLSGLEKICCIDKTKEGQLIINKNVKAWKNKVGYEERMKNIRGRKIALMPQGAKTALWPFGTIEQQIRKVYTLGGGQQQQAEKFVGEILQTLKLNEMAHKYPHELSGGACQRAIIGITLALNPTIIIADEPTTGLDTTLQVNIIELLNSFKEGKLEHQSTSFKPGLTLALSEEKGKGNVENKRHALIVISHDLRLMQKVVDKIVVMYAGEIVESGDSNLIRDKKATHPYTQQLLEIADINAPPFPPRRRVGRGGNCETNEVNEYNDANDAELPIISGEAPTLLNPPEGCKFHPRCPIRIDNCKKEKPQLIGESGHKVSCHVITNSRKSDTIA